MSYLIRRRSLPDRRGHASRYYSYVYILYIVLAFIFKQNRDRRGPANRCCILLILHMYIHMSYICIYICTCVRILLYYTPHMQRTVRRGREAVYLLYYCYIPALLLLCVEAIYLIYYCYITHTRRGQ